MSSYLWCWNFSCGLLHKFWWYLNRFFAQRRHRRRKLHWRPRWFDQCRSRRVRLGTQTGFSIMGREGWNIRDDFKNSLIFINLHDGNIKCRFYILEIIKILAALSIFAYSFKSFHLEKATIQPYNICRIHSYAYFFLPPYANRFTHTLHNEFLVGRSYWPIKRFYSIYLRVYSFRTIFLPG